MTNERTVAVEIEKLIDRRIMGALERHLPLMKYGTVAEPPTNGKVAVFLGEDQPPSTGFVIGSFQPVVGDKVRVHIGPRGDRYVDAIVGRTSPAPGEFRVSQYGAVFDDNSDDSRALQAAADAAAAAGGGQVYIDGHVLRVDAPVRFAPNVGLAGRGAGNGAPGDATVIISNVSGAAGVAALMWIGANNLPGTGWVSNIEIRDFSMQHSGSAPAMRAEHVGNVTWRNVVIRAFGANATGRGFELIDPINCELYGVRVLYFDGVGQSALRIENSGLTQPGNVVFVNVTARGAIAFDIVSASGVMDSLSFIGCIASGYSDKGFSLTGAGRHINYRWEACHVEAGNNTGATVGVYESGAGSHLSWSFSGMFMWQNQKAFDLAGTIGGVWLEGIYLNSNGHTAQLAGINVAAQCSRVGMGQIANADYATPIADVSDPDTRRKLFAGGLSFEVQLGVSQPLTNAAVDLGGLTKTATPAFPERWAVDVTADINITVAGAGLCTVTIVFDGANQRSAFVDPANGTGRFSVHVRKVISVTPNVAHTVKVQVSKANAGGTATAVAASCVMTLDRSGE